ncbi:MAG: hypothetical protein ABJH82_05340 [Polaribacter sp.]|uniref:hypothetical protein n=1 Tax=Polaribacter sp. TaxID=1920175 RepID=UPI0032662233
MKNNTLILTLILFTTSSFTQRLDSLKYISTFEKYVFNKKDSLNYKDSYFESLFSIDSTAKLKSVLLQKDFTDKFISNLDRDKINKSKNKKKIKYLFNKIHDNFLIKYENIVNFNKIFDDGRYNCVSASALFAYVFDSFNIPYQIKETPTHIYLIAFPNESNIYVETTIPGNKGFYSPSENDIKKSVDELINNKIITQIEVNKTGYKEAYLNFFYEKDFLKPSELIGVQYYNEGINYFQNENYEKAFYNFSKAEKFYNTKKVKYLKLSCLSLMLTKSNFNETKDLITITTLLNNLKYNKDFVKKDLGYYSSNLILANENNEEFLILATKYFEKIENIEVAKVLNKDLFKYIAETRYNLDKNLDDILKYALKVYHLEKNNEHIQNLISKSILKKYFYTTPNKKTVQKIEEYEIKYPFLNKSIFYTKYMIRVYSYMTSQYYYKKEPQVGSLYFDKLTELINNNKKEIELDQELIGNTYWSIGAYYYGKSKLEKAKKILEEGKKYAPEHHKLNKILSYVNDDLK